MSSPSSPIEVATRTFTSPPRNLSRMSTCSFCDRPMSSPREAWPTNRIGRTLGMREILRDPVRRLAVVSEDDDLRVRFLHELLADDPTDLRELRMFDLRGLGELDRLLRLGVLQELDVRLRLRVLLHVLEIQSEGAEPLRLREFDRVVRLHRDGLSRHRAVQTAILDAGIQTLAGLVSDRQEVLARHLRSAREEPELLQAGDLFIDDGLEELPDFLGDVRRLHRNPLDPQVVLVWHHIGVVLRSDLDRGDAEV